MELILPSKALLKPFIGLDDLPNEYDISSNELEYKYRHVFKIGELGLILPENSSNEVAEKLSCCQLPNTKTALYGMANLRGKIIPVINLYDLFGVEEVTYERSKMLIITLAEDVVGVLINDLPIRIKFTENHGLTNLPRIPEIIRPYINGCYRVDGDDWLSWEMNEFFDDVHNHIQ